ncbi:rRNA maturation RNase YbeY [Hyphococcus flavus]|uniref:Endoribonuclease YbeY n=1 Tax=Hyphococcus flavus TaxID=1866326 RepID=A0AAF0CGP0_9PROT|nr:rRNA maturation RNase YbeY [Hyphococcus flavus]WDI32669.1 rRNA maturation RNase YbeY [Hyphococcus flavus]
MIEVIFEDEGWREAMPDADRLAKSCQHAAARFEPLVARETALLLCSDATIIDLNARFRNRDKATNVLSFPSGLEDGFLGDIAVARETCLAEAAEKNIALRDHAAHLIIHAMLHLAGYDHERDADATVMENREAEILTLMGVADPYAEKT